MLVNFSAASATAAIFLAAAVSASPQSHGTLSHAMHIELSQPESAQRGILVQNGQVFSASHYRTMPDRLVTDAPQGSLLLGTPGKSVTLSFDTTSSHTCIKDFARANYSVHRSSSAELIDHRIMSRSSDDDLVYRDLVGVNTHMTNHHLVVKETVSFDNEESGGTVGLAVAATGNAKDSFLESLWEQKIILRRIFGMSLGPSGKAGEITLGHFNHALFDTLHWQRVFEDSNFWTVSLGLAINKKFLGLRKGLIDNGTPHILVPMHDAEAYHAAVVGSRQIDHARGLFALPCDTASELSFQFAGKVFKIASEYIVGDPLDVGGNECESRVVGVANSLSSETWVLGQAFLKQFYLAFDADARKFAFAEHK